MEPTVEEKAKLDEKYLHFSVLFLLFEIHTPLGGNQLIIHYTIVAQNSRNYIFFDEKINKKMYLI